MEPLTTSVRAGTIVTLLNSAAGEAGKGVWNAIRSAAGRLLERDGAETSALAHVDESAAEPQTGLPLAATGAAQTLLALAQRDGAFAELLAAWHRDAVTVTQSNVQNVVSGQVNGPVVQLHTNHGGISL